MKDRIIAPSLESAHWKPLEAFWALEADTIASVIWILKRVNPLTDAKLLVETVMSNLEQSGGWRGKESDIRQMLNKTTYSRYDAQLLIYDRSTKQYTLDPKICLKLLLDLEKQQAWLKAQDNLPSGAGLNRLHVVEKSAISRRHRRR